MKKLLILLIVFILSPCFLIAQSVVDTARQIVTPAEKIDMKKKAVEFIEKEKKDKSADQGIMQPLSSTDPRLDSSVLIAWQNYYGYMTQGYKHRKNVFHWQLLSSKIIFFVVVFLVLAGIYFAWLQFIQVIRKYKAGGKLAEELQTELTASAESIKVGSPVLGVIILVISFMFFFLYLKYVYPINEIF